MTLICSFWPKIPSEPSTFPNHFIQSELFVLIPLQSPKETNASPELSEEKNMEEDSAFDKSETNGWREDAVLLEIISKRCWYTFYMNKSIFIKEIKNCHKYFFQINTSYLTDSYILFSLKLESRQHFCSNRSIRSST